MMFADRQRPREARTDVRANIENNCGARVSAIPITFRGGFSRAARIVTRLCRCIVDRRASRALTMARQYFLKRDAVFSNVLVYSG
jgi:hypothetical protein